MFTRLESVNRIILSAGHGGLAGETYDPGAVSGSSKENIEVKQIIKRLVPRLSAYGLVVVVTPDYGLARTITYLNAQYDAVTDWALEIHKDSAETLSTSMKKRAGIYYHPTARESKDISDEMVKIFKSSGANPSSWSRPDTASNHRQLAWIRRPKMLSHLIECGFMQDDLSDAADDFYAEVIAKAIAHCLAPAF